MSFKTMLLVHDRPRQPMALLIRDTVSGIRLVIAKAFAFNRS